MANTPLDLTTLEPDVLDAMRIAILTEQERRQRVAELPAQITDACRAAVAAGVPAADVLAAAGAGAGALGEEVPGV